MRECCRNPLRTFFSHTSISPRTTCSWTWYCHDLLHDAFRHPHLRDHLEHVSTLLLRRELHNLNDFLHELRHKDCYDLLVRAVHELLWCDPHNVCSVRLCTCVRFTRSFCLARTTSTPSSLIRGTGAATICSLICGAGTSTTRSSCWTFSLMVLQEIHQLPHNNGKPWKSSRILRVKPNFFIFSLFVVFRHFFIFSFSFLHFSFLFLFWVA